MLTGIVLLMTLATPSPAQAHPLDKSHRDYHGLLPDDYYRQLAKLETDKPLTARHGTLSYTSPLGISRRTAFRFAGRTSLAGLPPEKLVEIADRIAFTGWTTKAGERVHPVGPFGWEVVRRGRGDLLRYICHAKDPKVRRWSRRACDMGGAHGR